MIQIFVALAIFAGIFLYGAFSWGFVTYCFYDWFILSKFPLLPHISMGAFVGIALFLYALLPKTNNINVKEDYRDDTKGWGRAIFLPWIVCLFGMVVNSIIN